MARPEIMSRPYLPGTCCEACVFGRGLHADWCLRSPVGEYLVDEATRFLRRYRERTKDAETTEG